MEIIPAIIPQNAEDLAQKLEAVKGLFQTVHIDFVEGEHFAEAHFQKSSGRSTKLSAQEVFQSPRVVSSHSTRHLKNFSRSEFLLEAHLMVADPQALIPSLVKNGFSRVLVQVEAMSAEAFAETIHEWRGAIEIGAALEIETPLSAVGSFAHELKTVQLMGIAHIGSQGQPFDERVIPRVRALHTARPHLTIAVDGGVNKKNAKMLTDAGAERLVVGSALHEFYG